MTIVHFQDAGRKSRADAARWVTHRLMEDAKPDQIVFELTRDGLSEAEAKEVFADVRGGLRAMGMPQGLRMILLVATLVGVALAEGSAWRWATPPRPEVEGYFTYLMTEFFIAIGSGALTAVATGIVSAGRRSWRLVAVAVATDVAAFASTSKVASASGPSVPLTVVGVVAAVVVTAWCLTRTRPWYELQVDSDGSFRFERWV